MLPEAFVVYVVGMPASMLVAAWRDDGNYSQLRIAVVVFWPIFAVRGLIRSFRKAWNE
jgi:hypothetical protein